ncbi:MAG: universal stress protein [Chlorobiaceae bacterium]|nr:universal stress protein [Chlorobiaceae bacterium]NTV24873.1 universal stress protein [Chlorobiaceae bacterium]
MTDNETRASRTILCPVDFSESSITTLQQIVTDFSHDIELNLLHVLEVGPGTGEHPHERPDVQFAMYLETLNQAGCQYRLFIESGSPAETIISFAGNLQPDFITIGSHGMTNLKCLVMGSTAEALLRYAPFPVLLYKAHPKGRAPFCSSNHEHRPARERMATMYWF